MESKSVNGNNYKKRYHQKGKRQEKKSFSLTTLLVWFCFFIIFTFCLTACGPAPVGPTTNSSSYKTVQDDTGASVKIPVHPERIVSMGVSTDDVVMLLVPTDRIKAISDLPSNLPEKAKEVKGRIRKSTEVVMSFQPDLMIAPSWVSPDFIQELRNLKVPVYVYKYPNTIKGTGDYVLQLGKLLHEEKRAQTVVDEMNQRIDRIKKFTANIPKDKRKVAVYYSSLGFLGGKNTYFNQFCDVAGLVNGGALAGLEGNQVGSKEALIKVNPDIIFIPSNDYDKDKYKALTLGEIYRDPAFAHVQAVENKAVYIVNIKWFASYSPFIVNSIEQMAHDAYGYEPPRNKTF